MRVEAAVPHLVNKNITHFDASPFAVFVISLDCDCGKFNFDLILPLLADVIAL